MATPDAVRAAMAAFDALPRAVRDRLNASPINVRADLLAADRRRAGWTDGQTIAFIARLEAAAPALLPTAQRTATNELAHGAALCSK